MDTNTIFSEIAQYRVIIAEAQAELDRLEAEVKEHMAANNLTELLGNEHKATYKAIISNRFDSKAFKADGYEDLYKAYQKPNTSMRFTFA